MSNNGTQNNAHTQQQLFTTTANVGAKTHKKAKKSTPSTTCSQSGGNAPIGRAHTKPDSLKIKYGSIDEITTTYKLSTAQSEAFARSHPSLSWGKQSAGPRLRISDGFKDHKHGLGALGRKTQNEEMLYVLTQERSFIDIGSSYSRLLGNYEMIDGVRDLCLKRGWAMTPRLGQRDTIRHQNNKYRIDNMVKEYNAIQDSNGDAQITEMYHRCLHPASAEYDWNGMIDKMQNDHEYQEEANYIKDNTYVRKPFDRYAAARANPRDGCGCSKSYEYALSIDSIYYDGVLEEIFARIALDESIGLICFNDYAAAIRKIVQKNSTYGSSVKFKKSPLGTNMLEFTGYAEKNQWDKPESRFIAEVEYNATSDPDDDYFNVDVKVEGNSMHYKHRILRTSDEDFFHYEYIAQNGIKYIMEFELIRTLENGDTPYKMYKIVGTRASDWNATDLYSLKLFSSDEQWMTAADLTNAPNKEAMMDAVELFAEETTKINPHFNSIFWAAGVHREVKSTWGGLGPEKIVTTYPVKDFSKLGFAEPLKKDGVIVGSKLAKVEDSVLCKIGKKIETIAGKFDDSITAWQKRREAFNKEFDDKHAIWDSKQQVTLSLNLFGVNDWKQKLMKSCDINIDLLTKHKERGPDFLQQLLMLVSGKTHSFRVRFVKGECYIMLSPHKKYFFGLLNKIDKGVTCFAKLDDVIDAYLRIGVKKQTTSIMLSKVQGQRDLVQDDKTNKNASLFNMSDSYTIARYIARIEEMRHDLVMERVAPGQH